MRFKVLVLGVKIRDFVFWKCSWWDHGFWSMGVLELKCMRIFSVVSKARSGFRV